MSNSVFKILLVDDEPDIVEFLGYNLKKEGYEILTANNGKDAVMYCVTNHCSRKANDCVKKFV